MAEGRLAPDLGMVQEAAAAVAEEAAVAILEEAAVAVAEAVGAPASSSGTASDAEASVAAGDLRITGDRRPPSDIDPAVRRNVITHATSGDTATTVTLAPRCADSGPSR